MTEYLADSHELEDEEILQRSLQHPSLFAQLVRKYEEPFLRKAQSIVREKEEAEDIVQEAFTKIYLTAITAKSKTIVIFINQIRMQIGMMFGNPETTTGGKALKFYTSVRLDLSRIAQIKKGEEVVGGRHRVKVVKNKIAAPFRKTEFDLLYNEGISREGELLALGESLGIIHKSGSSYSFGEEKLGRGYDASRTYLRENKKTANEILKEIRTALASHAPIKSSGGGDSEDSE